MAGSNISAPKSAETKFSWDYDVPDTPFWSDLDFTVGRNFLTCFSPSEIQGMHLDASLDKPQKLHLLLKLVQERLASREVEVVPESLLSFDFGEWQRLMLAIQTMQNCLGLPEEEETVRIIMKNGRDGKRNISGVNMMARFKEKHGLYSEAEALAREALPVLRGHEMLGVDSPQVLGTTRTLIRCVWKQGLEKEARKLVNETSDLIERMGHGKFRKYQAEEQIMIRDLVVELENWTASK